MLMENYVCKIFCYKIGLQLSFNVYFDKQLFPPDQEYVVLSRATSWNSVRITTLDLGEF